MPNNDENKPIRKTWLMLKRAVIDVPFTTDIFPLFVEKNMAKDDLSATHTDSRGTWKITSTRALEYLWELLDKEGGSSAFYLRLSSPIEITIDLPKGLLISPTTLRLKYGSIGANSTISGYDPQTKEWVVFHTFIDDHWGHDRKDTVPEALRRFYSAFKITCQSHKEGSTYDHSSISDFDIINGIYRIS